MLCKILYAVSIFEWIATLINKQTRKWGKQDTISTIQFKLYLNRTYSEVVHFYHFYFLVLKS